MNFILDKQRIIYYTKETKKVLQILVIPAFFIISLILLKFKPVFKVSIQGQDIGYVKSATELNNKIDTEVVENNDTTAKKIVTLDQELEYTLELVEDKTKTNEDEIVDIVKENADIMYQVYEVAVEDEQAVYTNTLEEAEQLVADIKEESNTEEIDISIKEIYTKDLNEIETQEVDVAKATISDRINEVKEKENRKERATINGVFIECKPTTGRITSRFGSKESIRNKAHTGLDLAAPVGTPIYAAAEGKVIQSTYSGGYGNVVKIDHGNGIQTYYAHCSKLLVKEGQTVKAGEKIATMGSTGRSTGSHLHFEIRIDGTPVNPQKYIY